MGEALELFHAFDAEGAVHVHGDDGAHLLLAHVPDRLVDFVVNLLAIEQGFPLLLAFPVENFEEFGKELFSKGSTLTSQKPDVAISSDFKVYSENGIKFGIGQIEVTTLQDVNEMSKSYLAELEKKRLNDALDWAMLLVTNVLSSESVLMTTNYKLNYRFAYEELMPCIFSLPGVLSRKKQLLPEVIRVIES